MLRNLTWEGAAALAAPLSYPPIENTINKKCFSKGVKEMERYLMYLSEPPEIIGPTG